MTTLLALMRDRMECMRVAPLLQAYLDGELTEEQALRVSGHVDACRRCGMAADDFRRIKESLSRLGGEPDHQAVERLQRFVDDLDPE